MKMVYRRVLLGLFIVVSAALGAAPAALAMTVQPVVIDLTPGGRGMSQIVTVENTFTNPLPVELRVEDLTASANGLTGTGKDSGDLLVFPPQAIIQPSQTQTFRIQYVGDPALATSKHYYVTIAQLPVKLPAGKSAIQILYNFRVLVSVAPLGVKPDLQVKSAEIGKNAKGEPIPVITVEDASTAYGYLSRGKLEITQRDAAGHEVFDKTLPGPELQQVIGFGLVSSGQTRRIAVPVVLPSAGGTLDVKFTPSSD